MKKEKNELELTKQQLKETQEALNQTKAALNQARQKCAIWDWAKDSILNPVTRNSAHLPAP